jgi:hypothetical protein
LAFFIGNPPAVEKNQNNMNPNLLRYAEEYFMEEDEISELLDTVEDFRLHNTWDIPWDIPIERSAALTCLKFNRGSEGGT